MEKYELLPQQLLFRNIVEPQQFFTPELASIDAVKRVHDPVYVDSFLALQLSKKEERRIGFIQNQAIVNRELTLIQGTISGALHALKDKIAFNIAGGTHHASVDFGEGFCMLNDQAIAAQYLLDYMPIKKILIIDLDVHQGNGTADIFKNRKDVFTFSMHGQNNYPFRKSKSHLDIGLADDTNDDLYLKALTESLHKIKSQFSPDFIFYQAGVDILASDKMGKLNCTLEGCKTRDQIVMQFAKKHNIPVQCSMGGGYSPDIKTILEAHTQTYLVANDIFY